MGWIPWNFKIFIFEIIIFEENYKNDDQGELLELNQIIFEISQFQENSENHI